MKSGIRLAMFRRDHIKGWAEEKKVWVRLEARKFVAKGITPSIQELGLIYDKTLEKQIGELK